MTKSPKSPVNFRRALNEDFVSLASIPMCLIATTLYLSSIHTSISDQEFNTNMFIALISFFLMRTIANIINSYSSLSEAHPMDAFTFLKRLKLAKEVSAIPSLTIARRTIFIAVIGLALNDLMLRYMVSNVGEDFAAINTNNQLLNISLLLSITLEFLSIFGKTTPPTSLIFTKRIYILDILTFTLIGWFVVSNLNNPYDAVSISYKGEVKTFRTSFVTHTNYDSIDLVYPTIMGSKPAAIKLLGLISAEDIKNDPQLAENLAKMLILNIENSNRKNSKPTFSPLVADMPNAYSSGDKDALLSLVNGDMQEFRVKTHLIVSNHENNDHSYAGNLKKLLVDAANLNSVILKGENKISSEFIFITNGNHLPN